MTHATPDDAELWPLVERLRVVLAPAIEAAKVPLLPGAEPTVMSPQIAEEAERILRQIDQIKRRRERS